MTHELIMLPRTHFKTDDGLRINLNNPLQSSSVQSAANSIVSSQPYYTQCPAIPLDMLLQDSFTCAPSGAEGQAARCSEGVTDPDDFGQMNTSPRCWTPHTKAAELVKPLNEQIKERKRTLGRTMACDGNRGQRYQNVLSAQDKWSSGTCCQTASTVALSLCRILRLC